MMPNQIGDVPDFQHGNLSHGATDEPCALPL